jgi:hypothetical protein
VLLIFFSPAAVAHAAAATAYFGAVSYFPWGNAAHFFLLMLLLTLLPLLLNSLP